MYAPSRAGSHQLFRRGRVTDGVMQKRSAGVMEIGWGEVPETAWIGVELGLFSRFLWPRTLRHDAPTPILQYSITPILRSPSLRSPVCGLASRPLQATFGWFYALASNDDYCFPRRSPQSRSPKALKRLVQEVRQRYESLPQTSVISTRRWFRRLKAPS